MMNKPKWYKGFEAFDDKLIKILTTISKSINDLDRRLQVLERDPEDPQSDPANSESID